MHESKLAGVRNISTYPKCACIQIATVSNYLIKLILQKNNVRPKLDASADSRETGMQMFDGIYVRMCMHTKLLKCHCQTYFC